MQAMAVHESTLAAWLLPLAGEVPSGVDARYDAGYELIRAELAKLDAVSAPPVDWTAVHGAADVLLRTRSKDLFIAAALARALHVEHGLSGLGLGLSLIGRLTTEFGSALFPTRARARSSALHWLTEQVARVLGEYTVSSSDRDVVSGLQEEFDRFVQGVRGVLGDDAPSFTELRDAISRMELSFHEASQAQKASANEDATAGTKPATEPKPPATSGASKPGGGVSPSSADRFPPGSAPSAPGSAADVAEYLSKTGTALTEAARLLWREDRASPASYRLLRTGLWLHLERPPLYDARGVTSIPAPEERLAESLPAMLQHAAWEQLLEVSEATLISARFWLDLHFFCDRALEGLGPTFELARAAARDGVRALLARMPQLTRLSFADGTPLARPETVSFLESVMGAKRRVGADRQEASEKDDLEALRGALRGSAPAQALADVDERRRICGSARQRFVLDMEVAGALVENNRPVLARSMFEALDLEAQRHVLESWEPGLALSMLAAYMRCLQTIDKSDPSIGERLQMLRARVAKLSPAALVSLGY